MRETSNVNTPSRRAQTHRKENCVLDGENYTREREGERIRMECEKEWGASSRRGHTLRFCDGTRVVF